jgi:hypothetical protein
MAPWYYPEQPIILQITQDRLPDPSEFNVDGTVRKRTKKKKKKKVEEDED